MSAPEQSKLRNRLLALIAPEDYALLRPHLQPVVLELGHVLVKPGVPNDHVHFLESGLASQIATTAENHKIEVGLYGRDGLGPSSSVLGVDSTPHQHIIQIHGDGFLIGIKTFNHVLEQTPAFRTLLMRYIQAFSIQTGYTALSNGSRVIGERLARWLLMCHDRIDGDDLAITHEFLGIMLGVRRSGVTDAIHILEGVSIIRAKRGHIHILDRERLEDTAGDSYGVPEAEYRRLIGPLN